MPSHLQTAHLAWLVFLDIIFLSAEVNYVAETAALITDTRTL